MHEKGSAFITRKESSVGFSNHTSKRSTPGSARTNRPIGFSVWGLALGDATGEEQADKASAATRKSEARKIHSLDLHKSHSAKVRPDTSPRGPWLPRGLRPPAITLQSSALGQGSTHQCECAQQPARGAGYRIRSSRILSRRRDRVVVALRSAIAEAKTPNETARPIRSRCLCESFYWG